MDLRSNLRPGSTVWAVRRAQWRALGLSDADMLKPKIAVINSSSELSICYAHLDGVAELVKAGVRAAGGVPFEIRTTAPSDFVTAAGRGGRYLMPGRDLVVNDIEVMVEGAQLDGMVALASCDKTTPAQLMAAARLNIPTLITFGGYQRCGSYQGRPADIEDVFEAVGRVETGELDLEGLEGLCDNAICSAGVCAGMGTANSMHIVCEALGLALPGNAPVGADSERMRAFAYEAGRRIVAMVEEELTPRRILSAGAFANAVNVAQAVSASLNVLRHLQAVSEEGEIGADVYRLCDRDWGDAPVLCAIRPNGPHRIEDLERAGGARQVMRLLRDRLDLDCLTATGRTVGENLRDVEPAPGEVIRSLTDPVSGGPALVIMRGNVAPEGALMKLGAKAPPTNAFEGRALVFADVEDATRALGDGRIRAGHVVVLRGLGPRGGPGVASASWFVAALAGTRLGTKVAVVTDGQLSGLNHGLVVGQVSPEAASGEGLALVRDGDRIVIDVARRRVDAVVAEAEFATRRAAIPAYAPRERRGWLALYERLVQPLSRGAVLRPDAGS